MLALIRIIFVPCMYIPSPRPILRRNLRKRRFAMIRASAAEFPIGSAALVCAKIGCRPDVDRGNSARASPRRFGAEVKMTDASNSGVQVASVDATSFTKGGRSQTRQRLLSHPWRCRRFRPYHRRAPYARRRPWAPAKRPVAVYSVHPLHDTRARRRESGISPVCGRTNSGIMAIDRRICILQ
jgi:hypothetical protein